MRINELSDSFFFKRMSRIFLVIQIFIINAIQGMSIGLEQIDFSGIAQNRILSSAKSGTSYIWSPNGSLLGTRIEFAGEAVQAASLPTDLDADSGEDISLLTRGENSSFFIRSFKLNNQGGLVSIPAYTGKISDDSDFGDGLRSLILQMIDKTL